LNDFAVLFYAILGSFGLAYCLFWITRRFFNHLSAATFLIGLIFLVQSTGLIWCIRRPLSYELAMVSAFCFSVCGFALNLSAVSNETHRNLKLGFRMPLHGVCSWLQADFHFCFALKYSDLATADFFQKRKTGGYIYKYSLFLLSSFRI
jgi:hypothetical protein